MPGETSVAVCADAAADNKDVMHRKSPAEAAALLMRDPLGLQARRPADLALVMIVKSFLLDVGWFFGGVSALPDMSLLKPTSTGAMPSTGANVRHLKSNCDVRKWKQSRP